MAYCSLQSVGANNGFDFTNALNANSNVFHQLDEHCHTVTCVLFDLRNFLHGTVEIDGFSRNDVRQITDCIYCCIILT